MHTLRAAHSKCRLSRPHGCRQEDALGWQQMTPPVQVQDRLVSQGEEWHMRAVHTM